MNFIQKAQAKQTGEASLTKLLHKIAGESPPRSLQTLHASAITYPTPEFCPREVVILNLLKRDPEPQYINLPTRVAFDLGEAIHDLVRNKWLRPHAVGDWTCSHCHSVMEFCKEPQHPCKNCGGKLWDYTEKVARSKTLPVSGSLDFIADVGLPKLVLTEIKSIDKDQFNVLAAPLAEHRVRTTFYLYLVADCGEPWAQNIDLTRSKVLYVSKGFGQKQANGAISPFKEFDVPFVQNSIEPYLAKATQIKRHRETGGIPKGICPTSYAPRVKSCNCPKECWGTDFLPS